MTTLSKSSDETIYLDRAGQLASEAYAAYHQSGAQTEDQVIAIALLLSFLFK